MYRLPCSYIAEENCCIYGPIFTDNRWHGYIASEKAHHAHWKPIFAFFLDVRESKWNIAVTQRSYAFLTVAILVVITIVGIWYEPVEERREDVCSTTLLNESNLYSPPPQTVCMILINLITIISYQNLPGIHRHRKIDGLSSGFLSGHAWYH